MMIGGIFSWLIIGLVIYYLFSRKGGMMGCCGGRNHNPSGHNDHANHFSKQSPEPHEDTIDLNEEDYQVRTKA